LYFFSALLNARDEQRNQLEYAASQNALFRHFASHAVNMSFS